MGSAHATFSAFSSDLFLLGIVYIIIIGFIFYFIMMYAKKKATQAVSYPIKKRAGYAYKRRNAALKRIFNEIPIKSASKPEKKYYEGDNLNVDDPGIGNWDDYLISGVADPILINPIGQGTGASQRIGTKIVGVSLRFRAEILFKPAVTDTKDNIRFICIYDRQPRKSTPGLAELFSIRNAPTLSMIDLTDSRRYLNLADEHIIICKQASNETCMIDIKRKFSLESFYSGTDGEYADISTGTITVWILNNSATEESSPSYARYVFRYRYYDT